MTDETDDRQQTTDRQNRLLNPTLRMCTRGKYSWKWPSLFLIHTFNSNRD